MKSAILGHDFNRRYLAAFRVETKHQAGKNRTPIDQYRARAAFAKFAAMLRSGEIQIFTEDFKQSLVWCERNFGRLTVQNEPNVRLLFGHLGFLCELCAFKKIISRKGAKDIESYVFAPAASCFFVLPNTTLSISRVLPMKTASESSAGRSSILSSVSRLSASFRLT